MQSATIDELSGFTAPYALQISGDRLAPELHNRQYVRIEPSATSKPGDLVVAAIRNEKPGVMRQNGDGDLWDYKGGYVPAGEWRPLGIVSHVLTR